MSLVCFTLASTDSYLSKWSQNWDICKTSDMPSMCNTMSQSVWSETYQIVSIYQHYVSRLITFQKNIDLRGGEFVWSHISPLRYGHLSTLDDTLNFDRIKIFGCLKQKRNHGKKTIAGITNTLLFSENVSLHSFVSCSLTLRLHSFFVWYPSLF